MSDATWPVRRPCPNCHGRGNGVLWSGLVYECATCRGRGTIPGLPTTVEEVRAAEAALEVDPVEMPEELKDPEAAWERMRAKLREGRKCDHCGDPLPAGRIHLCRGCEEALYPDTPDYSSDMIDF